MSFLTARWENLIVANYPVDPEILLPYVPAGTELDIYDGQCYVSLVGFMFLNTKLRGIRVPFHINFEEVNLRFYVKRQEGENWKRGVVFIREIVPKRMITFVANTVYSENYVTRQMKHEWKVEDQREISYQWRRWGQNWSKIAVQADLNSNAIADGSLEEFILEHYWGYAKRTSLVESVEYEVTHPKWEVYLVTSYQIEVDFGQNYGPEFAFLNNVEPSTVYLAKGSEITVEKRRIIKEHKG